jgi:hypothetical protein
MWFRREGAMVGRLLHRFIEEVNAAGPCRMLHMGTKRSDESRSTFEIEKSWFGPHVEHVGTDFEEGIDVNVVSDAHSMDPELFGRRRFDFVLSCSVFEHLRRPWVVPDEIRRNSRLGTLLLVQTHFAFPEHGYPSDFTRWTREGLEELFRWSRSWEILDSEYEFPCRIIPPPEVEVWNEAAPAWLNVNVLARAI